MSLHLNTGTVIRWLSVLVALLPFRGYGFEVQGTIHYESYLGGVTNLATTKLFKVEVHGCEWRIRTSSPEDCSFSEKSFRQGDLFNLTMFCASSTGRSSNTPVAFMETDELPDDDGSQINYLWLAYASSCYLDNEDGVFLRPICCLDDHQLRFEKFKVQSYFTRSEAAPRLPIWLAYVNDGFYRTTGSQGRSVFKAPPPFDAGYTNAIYSALKLTNYGTLQIPVEFEFTRFAVPRNSSNQSTLVLRTRIRAEVTKIEDRDTSQNLLPQFLGEIDVLDSRNSRIGQLRYRIRDSVWANETNAAVAKGRALKERDLRDRAESMAQPRKGTLWFRAIWVGFGLLSLAVLCKLLLMSKMSTK